MWSYMLGSGPQDPVLTLSCPTCWDWALGPHTQSCTPGLGPQDLLPPPSDSTASAWLHTLDHIPWPCATFTQPHMPGSCATLPCTLDLVCRTTAHGPPMHRMTRRQAQTWPAGQVMSTSGPSDVIRSVCMHW